MKTKIQELFKQAKDKANEAKALLVADEPDVAKANELIAEAEGLREQAKALKTAQGIVDEIGLPVRGVPLPMGADPVLPQGDGENAVAKAVNILRFGEANDPTSVVMREIYGGDYRQKTWEQDQAFDKYLRTGIGAPILRKQYWPAEDVKRMLIRGQSVAKIKATMIEGQDELGGYAVPPQRANNIVQRVPGLTAVRGGGATVVDTTSNMIEWLKLTGGGDRYPTAMRGLWGTEVQSPDEDDFSIGLMQIVVHTYTFKVPFSQSLVEDAANLIDIFTDLVSVTLAIDEDEAFLIGDGAGKPRGILPSSANAHSLTEVVSGHATLLQVETVKGLRRGIASQYRLPGRCSWVGESDTADALEQFQDGSGRFYFEYLDSGERFMRSAWRESEAMPTIAADAYPLLFGDLSGYAIVQRLGLSVVRFQDSNTGINKVEFHVRRRIGGNLVWPWKLAVQKVSAS